MDVVRNLGISMKGLCDQEVGMLSDLVDRGDEYIGDEVLSEDDWEEYEYGEEQTEFNYFPQEQSEELMDDDYDDDSF